MQLAPGDLFSDLSVDCPKCHQPTFAVSTIADEHFLRRCKVCFFPERGQKGGVFRLPKVHKRVIYLDQMAISNFLILVNPASKRGKDNLLDPRWETLLKRLQRLIRLQAICCPASSSHESESVMSQHYEGLVEMADSLSGGAHFKSHNEISQRQLYDHALKWARGDRPPIVEIDRE